MADALHVQLDLLLTGGTYHNATCRYANYVHPSYPLYPARITAWSYTHELPEITSGGLARRSASVQLSDKELNRLDAPTLAAILKNEDPRGKRAVLTVKHPVSGATIYALNGIVSSVGQDYRSLTIEGDNPALVKTLLPQPRVLDYFPSADCSHCDSKDPPITVVWGPMPRVTLPLAVATFCNFETTMGGGESNKYVYADLTSVPNVIVAAGDMLVYDIRLNAAGVRHAIDLRCSDGTLLRNTAAVDQKGLAAHPNTNLDAVAVGKYYRREIDISVLAGKTVTEYLLGGENDTAATFISSIANAYIIDANGAVKVTIYDETINNPVIAIFDRNNVATTATFTRFPQWRYGPIRPPASGALSVRAGYVDGRVRDPSSYTLVLNGGHYWLYFTSRPFDTSGRPAKVQWDLDSTEFGRNPANILKFIWGDASMLGQAVNAASFSAAASVYAGLGNYETIVGGLVERRAAHQLIKDFSLRGATFDQNSAGEITMTVDASGLHPAAPVRLGYQDAYGLNNAEVLRNNDLDTSIIDKVKQFDLLSYRDPGLGVNAKASYLISATRSRATGGATVTQENDFLGSGKLADAETDYRFKLLVSQDFDVEVATGVTIGSQVTLGQLVQLHAPRYYFDGTQYMIRRIQCDGSRYTLRLIGYDAALFTYAPGDVKASRLVTAFIDYSQTEPGALANLSVSYTYDTDSQGNIIAVARLQADAPSVNVNAIVFRAKRWVSGSPTGITFAEQRIPCTPGQTAVKAELELGAGVKYDIEAQAFNGLNAAAAQYGPVATFPGSPVTIPKDTVGPGAPTSLLYSIRAGENRARLQATMPSAADVEIVKILRSIDTNFGNAVQVGYRYASASEVVEFEDQDLAFNTPLYYWFQCLDFSKNAGTVSARLDVPAIPPSRVAHTINPKRDKLFHFDFNAKSTQGLGPLPGFVATIRGIEGKFGGALAIEEARTNLLNNAAFQSGGTTSWALSNIPGGSSITVEKSDHPDFTYHVRLSDKDAADDLWARQDVIYTSGQVSAGDWFSTSCYARVLDLEVGTPTLFLRMYDDLDAQVASASVNLTDTDWQRYEVSLAAPSLTSPRFVGRVRTWLNYAVSATGVTTATGFSLERGAFATSYAQGARAAGSLKYPESILPAQAGTVGVWVYVRSGSPHSASDTSADVFDIQNAGGSSNRLRFHKLVSSTSWRAFWANAAGTSTSFSVDASVMTPGWHFVVLTWAQASTYAEIFVDGVSRGSTSSANLPRTFAGSNGGAFWVGSTVGGASSHLNSMIDEMVILPQLVKAEEALRWYRQDAPFYDPEAVERGQEPGPPADAFVTGNFTLTNTALLTGGRRHLLHWDYTTPAPGSADLRPDGIRLYFELGNITDPEQIDQGHTDLGAGARDYSVDWGHVAGGTYSYAVSAFRRTRNGVEETAKVNVASWRGASIDNKIGGGGIGDDTLDTPHYKNLSITNAKIGNLAVTDAKVLNLGAAKIQTQNLTIDTGITGADALIIKNNGKVRLTAGTSYGDSNIIFETTGGTELAKITSKSSGEVTIEPIVSTTGTLLLGRDSVQLWDTIEMAANSRVHITAGASGFIHLRSKIEISTYDVIATAPGARVAREPRYDASGNFLGYVNITAT